MLILHEQSTKPWTSYKSIVKVFRTNTKGSPLCDDVTLEARSFSLKKNYYKNLAVASTMP
jgi:hypothetical protein